jgi:2-methylcitrate dehydratase PrpD
VTQSKNNQVEGTMASISRQLAQWITALRYDDLPAAVVDRAKGVTLHNIASMLIGSQTNSGKQAVKFVTEDESTTRNGATLVVYGTQVTKGGAAFANSEMAMAGGKLDSFRMLTHPGTSIIPSALIAAEIAGASGKNYITGIAAAYEAMERMAADVIPSVMARGFHASPVFGIFGAAIAAGKILRMSDDQMNSCIALCASLAASNLEGGRSGGKMLREGAAVRNAMLAVALAQQGHVSGETVLEGEAGFYHAYTGNNMGKLSYSFVGDTQTSLAKITEGLGKDWIFLETLYRIYSTAGYNIGHVAVTAKLCEEHNIRYEDIDRIEAVVNWLETQYPSPAFPARRETGPARPGSTGYFTAYGAVARGFPVERRLGVDPAGADVPPEVLDLMKRVTIIPSNEMTLFGPRITIFTKDGKSYTRQGTGREFVWDFEEEARRIRAALPSIPISPPQFEKIVSTCRDLDRVDRAHKIVELTL